LEQQQDPQREPEQDLWWWTHIPEFAWTSDCTAGTACGIFYRFYNTQPSNSQSYISDCWKVIAYLTACGEVSKQMFLLYWASDT